MGPPYNLEKCSKLMLLAIGAGILAFVAWLDWVSGPAYSFAIFYLLPIYFVTWYLGAGAGMGFSFVSVLTMAVIDLHSIPFSKWGRILTLDRAGKLVFFLVTTLLLSRLREVYQHEREASRIDPLTGIANRRAFFDFAERERIRSARYLRPITIAYIDVDDFKQVNDRLGHGTGDVLLTEIAQTLRQNIRETDMVARMGGDEFILLLPEADQSAARTVIHKVHELLLDLVRELNMPISFSIGAVTFRSPVASADEMVRAADSVMYSAKNKGKDGVEFRMYPERLPHDDPVLPFE